MKKALIEPDGRIAQIENEADIFPVHPSLEWVSVSDDVTTMYTWVDGIAVSPPQPSLAEVKQTRIEHINTRRDWVIGGGVIFDGDRYDTNQQKISNLAATVTFLEAATNHGKTPPATVIWRDEANKDHDLTPTQLVGLGEAIFTQAQAAHFTARSLKDQITLATTISAVEAIDWPA